MFKVSRKVTPLIFRATISLIFLIALFATGSQADAQEADVIVIPPPPELLDDPLTQAYETARMLFNDGLATMNEATLRRAAGQYERIIEDYSLDPRHFDAYFSAAYIHMEYLQSSSDYEHARNLLSLLINNHPSSFPEVADAYITRAHIEYRCLRDYRAAQMDLSAVLNSPQLAVELGTRDVEVKVLLTKCRQKLGEYDMARRIWEELHFSNPELDTEGRLQWIRNSAEWFLIDDGTARLYFEDGVERDTYTACLAAVHEGLAAAEAAWGLMPGGTIEVFLYASSDHLFDYTLRSNGFALPVDAEIHLAPTDIPDLGHLTGWLTSRRLNTRPDPTVSPLLRAGFNHYFLETRRELDAMAAREIYYYGGTIPDNELLFPLSYNYTFSEEYAAMAASFMHYLIEDAQVDLDDLETFYRLLWARNDARWEAPLMAEIMRQWDLESTGTTWFWEQGLVTPEQVYDLFRTLLGVNLAEELQAWQDSLAGEIAAVEAELGTLTAEVEPVEIDLSTPESALQSWWNAYRAGDFDGMIAASTREMARFLEEARDYYEEQGILEAVIMDYFVRPYRNARMVVTQQGTFADDLFVFDVQIERDDETKEKTIVVRMEGGVWRVDSN